MVMKTSLIVLSVLVIGTAVAFAANQMAKPELDLRYKITVNVETPDGVKSGSAVREIVIDKLKGFNPDKADFNSDIYGEAVVVDLNDKKLFGLLNWDAYNEVFHAFSTLGAPLSEEGIAYYNNLPIGAQAKLKDKKKWPKFVTFEDMNDPMSVQAVDHDDLSETFGQGYTIKNIEIEITDQQINWNMPKILPWIEQYRNKLFDGRTIHLTNAENKLANSLGAGSFIVRRTIK